MASSVDNTWTVTTSTTTGGSNSVSYYTIPAIPMPSYISPPQSYIRLPKPMTPDEVRVYLGLPFCLSPQWDYLLTGRWYPYTLGSIESGLLSKFQLMQSYSDPNNEMLAPVPPIVPPKPKDLGARTTIQKKTKEFLSTKGCLDFQADTAGQISDLLTKVRKAERVSL